MDKMDKIEKMDNCKKMDKIDNLDKEDGRFDKNITIYPIWGDWEPYSR